MHAPKQHAMKEYRRSGGEAPCVFTLALGGSKWLASPGKEPPVPIGYEAGLAPEPVWTCR
jgi:hypothetical protein